MQAFKSITTSEYIRGVKHHGWQPFSKRLWQRNYYEHVIRDEDSMNRIRDYIINNPLRWELDRENPCRRGEDPFDDWLDSFRVRPRGSKGVHREGKSVSGRQTGIS